MENNPLLRRLMKTTKEDVAHTSAYASSQTQSFGASSSESFAARRKIDQNRTIIKSYNDSKIATSAFSNAPRPKQYDKSKDSTNSNQNSPKDGSSVSTAESAQTGNNSYSLRNGKSTPASPGLAPKTQTRPFMPQIKPNIKPKF